MRIPMNNPAMAAHVLTEASRQRAVAQNSTGFLFGEPVRLPDDPEHSAAWHAHSPEYWQDRVKTEWRGSIGRADYVITSNGAPIAWRHPDGLWTSPEAHISARGWPDDTRKHRKYMRDITGILNPYAVQGEDMPAPVIRLPR